MDGERFLGWRLTSIDPEHHGFDGVDLRPDDVLVALNGRSISRPDQLQQVWDELRGAAAVVADLKRGEAKLQLRWVVTD
jgi:type II secretory pathway component PulC